MTKHRFSIPVFLVLCGFFSSRSLAQTPNCYCDTAHWTYCSQISPWASLAFLNGRVGFAYMNYGSLYEYDAHAVLFRTNDSGLHWTKIDSTPYGFVYDLSFISLAHGYAAVGTHTYGNYANGEIYETWDSGYTWKQLTIDSETVFTFVRASGKYVIAKASLFVESFDGGHTWQTAFSSFSQPTDYVGDGGLFSNRSGTIATLGYHRNDQRVIATTDDGESWNAFPVAPALTAPIYIPPLLTDQGRSLFMSNGVVQRDLNLGSTWDTVLKKAKLVADIEGAGCAMYINQITGSTVGQGSSGLFYRSTDLGNSWQVMTTPAFGGLSIGQRYFNVVGHGSTVYVLSAAGALWRTIDGGDGTLGHNIDAHTTHLSYSSLALTAKGDTLVSALCDSATLSLQFQYAGSCSSARLDHVFIKGLDSAEYRVSIIRHSSSGDSTVVTIAPSLAGLRIIAMHAIYINDELEETDTTIALVLNVHHTSSALKINAPSTIDFGSQSIWTAKKLTDTISISAFGCEPLTINSIALLLFPGSSGFEFKNVGSFVATTSPRPFPISYKPVYAETDSALLLIASFNGGTQRVDTIHVMGQGVDNTQLLVGNPVEDQKLLSFDVYDILGKQIERKASTSLDQLELKPGFYIVRISNGEQNIIRKIVIGQ